MLPMRIGDYTVSTARTKSEIAQALMLRQARFRFGSTQSDADCFDLMAQHLLIRDARGDLHATCRMMVLNDAGDFAASYVGQVYDLSSISDRTDVVLELGRLCLAQKANPDCDTLRALWAGVTRIIADTGARMVIGCTSFHGADPARHAAALSHLHAHHLGPAALRPARRAAEIVALTPTRHSAREALKTMPTLLRMYLGLGGWVSDHAVIDRDLDTLHVFTALELAAIPVGRARVMRQLADA